MQGTVLHRNVQIFKKIFYLNFNQEYLYFTTNQIFHQSYHCTLIFRKIPVSLILSFMLTILLYVSLSASYISIYPWYNGTIYAPFATAYASFGWDWAKYVVMVGVFAAASTVVIGCGSAVTRYVFAMARDGLIMKVFGKVNETSKVVTNFCDLTIIIV